MLLIGIWYGKQIHNINRNTYVAWHIALRRLWSKNVRPQNRLFARKFARRFDSFFLCSRQFAENIALHEGITWKQQVFVSIVQTLLCLYSTRDPRSFGPFSDTHWKEHIISLISFKKQLKTYNRNKSQQSKFYKFRWVFFAVAFIVAWWHLKWINSGGELWKSSSKY